jgi:hypothetical protein
MPGYLIRHGGLRGPAYLCFGDDDETAIWNFNATDGEKVEKVFTTIQNAKPCADWKLHELQWRGDDNTGSQHDIREIKLYEKLN